MKSAPIVSLGIALAATGLLACGTPTDPAWLTGTWAFAGGAQFEVTCLGSKVAASIGAAIIKVRETPSGVEFDLGCRCRLAMTADGALAPSGQACNLVTGANGETPFDIQASVSSWNLTPGSSPDHLRLDGSGSALPTGLNNTGSPITCAFTIDGGELTRTDRARPDCDTSGTAVGVYSVASQCPLGAGTDGVLIVMAADTSTGCAAVSGDLGEPGFAVPSAVKSPPPCNPAEPKHDDTRLHFCRVDGQLFKPFPAEAGVAGAYAVLKLDDQCPPGAIEVSKAINNDDGARANGSLGDIRPNISSNELPFGTFTELHFCLFPPASDDSVPTLSTLPFLGFSYAVFHDFEGSQPAWVRNKLWRRSDDESAGSENTYFLPDRSTTGPAIDLLKRMVEDVPETEMSANDTMFDLATAQ